MKILYISGTRADYGLMRNTLFEIQKNPKLSLEVAVTGMHLMKKFGNTLKEISKDGFKTHIINAVYEKDDEKSMADFIGKCILILSEKIIKIKPDIILLLGDRSEMLAAAIVGAYMNIPVAHIHGGDKSGTVDDLARNAITKLSSFHFPTTNESKSRIIEMGEDPRKVFLVGAPGLDDIFKVKFANRKNVFVKYGLDYLKPVLLIIQHPVTGETAKAGFQMEQTLSAAKELGLQSVVIYPNADEGNMAMIRAIEQRRKYPLFKIYKNIARMDYLELMSVVSCIAGNSSGGIIEAPSFHLPVVNIGTRQSGRETAGNIINTGYKKEEIKKAIKKAVYDKQFLKKIKKVKSPYGTGEAGKKISKILSNLP